MQSAGINLVIIQFLKENKTSFLPKNSQAADPTNCILNYADKHKMQVFIGLETDDGWWMRFSDLSYLKQASGESCQIADRAWKLYGRHSSFAGWYIPQEPWDANCTHQITDYLGNFFHTISVHCKGLSGGKPVSFAPFFSHTSTPFAVEQAYKVILRRAGVDILMLQDGVGARGWDANIAENIIPYFRAFRNACLANGVRLWSDLESFSQTGKSGDPSEPATVGRIERQFTAEAPYVKTFVTFDFFHYMSPYRGAPQAKLFRNYIHDFVQREFYPTFGRAVEVDPSFPYYQGRSPDSIAAEIRANGYDIVDYVLTADSSVNPKLISAFHERHIGVWYCTFANGTYNTVDLPKGWRAWKMVTRADLQGAPLNDGFTRLCLNNTNYREWKKKAIVSMLRRYPFQGVQILEPYWPGTGGSLRATYACFCPSCLKAFKRMYPQERALPNILDMKSPNYPSNNPSLWKKWLSFRHTSVTDFLNDLVNGPGGIREESPHTKVCIWTLALASENGIQLVKEYNGVDPYDISHLVRPDIMCIETDWPDWERPNLPPDYVKHYAGCISAIKGGDPSMPIMIQADIGSIQTDRRSDDWISAFRKACREMGVSNTTLYEYAIGKYMYTEPPRITSASRDGEELQLVFNRRIDPEKAASMTHYSLSTGRITAVQVDGCIVRLTLTGLKKGDICSLAVHEMPDDPAKLLYHDHPSIFLKEQKIKFRW